MMLTVAAAAVVVVIPKASSNYKITSTSYAHGQSVSNFS